MNRYVLHQKCCSHWYHWMNLTVPSPVLTVRSSTVCLVIIVISPLRTERSCSVPLCIACRYGKPHCCELSLSVWQVVFSFVAFHEGPKWNHSTERSISRCVLFCSWTTTTFVAHEVSIFTETQVWHTKSSDSPCVLLTRVYSCLFNNSHVLYIEREWVLKSCVHGTHFLSSQFCS